MKKILIPVILILLVAPVLANPLIQELTTSLTIILESGEILGYNLEEFKTTCNQNVATQPWIVRQIIGDERFNLYLTKDTGEMVIGGITENAIIISIQEGEIEDPSLNIYVSENTLNKVKNQEITVTQALDTELIRYESVSVITSVKMWFADKALTIVSWFT